MKRSKFLIQNLLIVFISSGALFFTACDEDENDDMNDPDNSQGEVWEPYQLEPNTAYEYDFSITDGSGAPTSSGSVRIDIGDPEVEVSGDVDNQNFSFMQNSSDNVNDNFIAAVSQSPIGMTLYQPFWFGAFAGQSLEVGNSWSYTIEGSSIEFNVTGTQTIAGWEGFIVETDYYDAESEESISWTTCVNQEVPLPLMANIKYNENEEYYIELTNYEN